MKRWLSVAARLYPRKWRDRYGAEFEAHLESLEPEPGDVFDILRGAAMMQLKAYSSYLKLAGVLTLAGLLAGVGASLFASKSYVSSAVVRAVAEKPETIDRIRAVWDEVTSRGSLAEVIQHPRLDLYSHERHRKPIEDIIDDMRTDLRLDIAQIDGVPSFRISFAYPDRYKAQLVVDRLTRKMLDQNPENAHRGLEPPMVAGKGDFVVVASASLPQVPLKPDRRAFLGWGFASGLLAGVLAAMFRWRAKWTLNVLAWGLAGGAAVLAMSLLIPQRYTSTAEIRVSPLPRADGTQGYLTDPELANWLRLKQQDIIGDGALADIIERLDLYERDRKHRIVDPAIASIHRDLSIKATTHSMVAIAFTYPDRQKAKDVVTVLAFRLMESAFVSDEADLMAYHPPPPPRTVEECVGKRDAVYLTCIASLPSARTAAPFVPPRIHRTARELIYVVDPASYPETPVSPDRRILTGGGLLMGLILGACWLRRRTAVNDLGNAAI